MTEGADAHKTLDLIAIGRCSVDLYGQQIGCRLEDVASFAKSSAAAGQHRHRRRRLGLKSALITRVGPNRWALHSPAARARWVVTDGCISTRTADASRVAPVQAEGVSRRSSIAPTARHGVGRKRHRRSADRAGARDRRDGYAFLQTHAAARRPRRSRWPSDTTPRSSSTSIIGRTCGARGPRAGFARYVKSEAVSTRLSAALADCD